MSWVNSKNHGLNLRFQLACSASGISNKLIILDLNHRLQCLQMGSSVHVSCTSHSQICLRKSYFLAGRGSATNRIPAASNTRVNGIWLSIMQHSKTVTFIQDASFINGLANILSIVLTGKSHKTRLKLQEGLCTAYVSFATQTSCGASKHHILGFRFERNECSLMKRLAGAHW